MSARDMGKVVLLMVPGGSDSTAMLELACAVRDESAPADDELASMMARMLSAFEKCQLRVLHVNHMLRGEDANADERFVLRRCEQLGVPCEVRRVDIPSLAAERKGGTEALAREERYRLAHQICPDGVICTAHTLDDRVETFYMRSLGGTGPGGFASIPRVRDQICRPLIDATREQLRDWLRARHPGIPDTELWREDATNDDGTNFRSQTRTRLIPILRELRPGFEKTLAQTMDLIAEEDEMLHQQAVSIVYRNLSWDEKDAELPIEALRELARPMARRVLRTALLVVNPDARLESAQINRILDNLTTAGYAPATSGGIRVLVCDDKLAMHRALS